MLFRTYATSMVPKPHSHRQRSQRHWHLWLYQRTACMSPREYFRHIRPLRPRRSNPATISGQHSSTGGPKVRATLGACPGLRCWSTLGSPLQYALLRAPKHKTWSAQWACPGFDQPLGPLLHSSTRHIHLWSTLLLADTSSRCKEPHAKQGLRHRWEVILLF